MAININLNLKHSDLLLNDGTNPHGTTKSDVGLGNVDNTSDDDKPISNATQEALDDKQDTLVSGTNIKTINGETVLGSGDVEIDTIYNQNSTIENAVRTVSLFGSLSSHVLNLGSLVIRGDGSVYNDDGTTSLFFGLNAGSSNTGAGNVGVGLRALLNLTTGISNNAIGEDSLANNISGGNNIGVGRASLLNVTNSGSNIALGTSAGRFTNAGGNLSNPNTSIFIGFDTRGESAGNSNEIVIGVGGRGNGSNTATFGNDDIKNTYLKGKVHINDVLHLTGTTSDPSSLTDGDMWHRSDTDEIRARIGGATYKIDLTAI